MKRKRPIIAGADPYGVPLDNRAWDVEDWRILYEAMKGQQAILLAARKRIGERHRKMAAASPPHQGLHRHAEAECLS